MPQKAKLSAEETEEQLQRRASVDRSAIDEGRVKFYIVPDGDSILANFSLTVLILGSSDEERTEKVCRFLRKEFFNSRPNFLLLLLVQFFLYVLIILLLLSILPYSLQASFL